MVVAQLRRVRRRAAGDLRRRRRLGLQLRSPRATAKATPKLLWKFDANSEGRPNTASAAATRNQIIAMPVIYDGLVYIAVGRGSRARRRIGPLVVHRSPPRRRRREPEAGVQFGDPASRFRTSGCRRSMPEEGDFARQSELRGRVALQPSRPQRRRQDRVRRDHAPHGRQRRHQGRHPLHRRLQRPVPLPRRQDRQGPLDLRHARRLPGARR